MSDHDQAVAALQTDPSQEPLRGADADWTGKSVLIVDDNATNATRWRNQTFFH